MKKLIVFMFMALFITSCAKEEFNTNEPDNQTTLDLVAFRPIEGGGLSIGYSPHCYGCQFETEGQTMTYTIKQQGEVTKHRQFPNRGKFICNDGCVTRFHLVFSGGAFESGVDYEIITTYTIPDNDCGDSKTIDNQHKFTY